MHHIQRKILNKLLYAESLPYAQLRPDGVESNHFAYHLERLIKDGLIAKTDKQYELAPQGLALVDRMSQEKMVERLQPHILTVVSVTNDKGETLLFRRAFQPYINRWGFPLGKVHFEETVEQAAYRELQEKTGLIYTTLIQRGMVYLTVKQDEFVITKVLCHVFEAAVADKQLIDASHRGFCAWMDTTKLTQAELMPGFLEIERLLRSKDPGLFFDEFSSALL